LPGRGSKSFFINGDESETHEIYPGTGIVLGRSEMVDLVDGAPKERHGPCLTHIGFDFPERVLGTVGSDLKT